MGLDGGFTPTGSNAQTRSWMSHVEARLEVMETQQRLFKSSIKGGAMVVYDEDLNQVSRMGVATFGTAGDVRTTEVISATRPDGSFHELIDFEHGWMEPRFQYNWQVDTFVPVTAASYTNVYKSAVTVTADVLIFRALVTADASTTGRVRLRLAGSYTDPITLAGGDQTTIEYKWDLTNVVQAGVHSMKFQAQRDTGAGNINVYAPDLTYFNILPSHPEATANGIPTA